MALIFLNGRFHTDPTAAQLGALDAGLQHGVGLFETMLGIRGGDANSAGPPEIMLGEPHIARLCESARILGLSTDLREGALLDATMETFRRSGLARARLRLTITGGDLNMIARPAAAPGSNAPPGGAGAMPRASDPTVMIVAQPATPYPETMLRDGVSVVIAGTRANPLNPFEGHKTLNYWWRLRELQLAAAARAGEALVFSISNHLVGGCVSNALLVKNGTLITPIARGEEAEAARADRPAGGAIEAALRASQGGDAPRAEAGGRNARSGDAGQANQGVSTGADDRASANAGGGDARTALASATLPGITRRWAIETAEGLGVLTTRRMVTIDDVLGADEVFLTNSSWGVLPVVRVEARPIASGTVGPVTRQLVDAWRRETSE